MDTEQAPTFGELLKRYRVAAGLSQETLAERARLSVQAISTLERGVKQAPYRETVRLLATALGLPAEEAARLEASVPRRRGPPELARQDMAPAAVPAEERQATERGAAPLNALPTGTLTFLLTDIEGSTALWERDPGAMQAAVARHVELVTQLLAQHGGRRIKERGEGDSVFAVFTSPSAALAAASALQQALLAEPSPPETPLRVRMGLHTGEAELRAGDYYGATVNRAARIRSLAHGGQILISRSTASLVHATMPTETNLRSLGAHSLKGFTELEEIFQVCHPRLPDDFPPLHSPQAPTHNLPEAPTRLIGREAERRQVHALLGTARLVTLTGAGGVGKTRLTLGVADEAVGQYPDGVWLVELAALANSSLVPATVARALGVREVAGHPLLATVTEHLQRKQMLLVLDNCEHLVEGCVALAARLLQDCPGVRMLATSREGLEVPGEQRYRVPSLQVPDLDHLPSLEELSQVGATSLFLDRAKARRPEFSLTAENAQAVSQICVRLEGIPLAIELAAARLSVLSVAEIAARLDDCFRLLTGGPRTALPRQQTLRAALEWSHDLLTEPERALLRRLAVFAGGWTLEAAEAIGMGAGVEEADVFDLLAQLVNKSLVLLEDRGEEARYRLLETVRQYARERLVAAGELAGTCDRHLAWYVALGEQAAPVFRGPQQGLWLARLEREHDNLRAALTWSTLDERRAAAGVQLAGAIWPFWWLHSHLSEGRQWLIITLASGSMAPAGLRARALHGAGQLATYQGAFGQAIALHEEALVLYRELGDQPGIARALHFLGHAHIGEGSYDRARLAFEESLALHRALDNKAFIATNLHGIGLALLLQGDGVQARAALEESIALASEVGDNMTLASALRELGILAYFAGNHVRGLEAARQSLILLRDLGERSGLSNCLAVVAAVLAALGQPQRAAWLLGAVGALQESIGYMLPGEAARRIFDRVVGAVQQALGADAFAIALARGRTLDLAEAIAIALQPVDE
jgi:predicted ATPase/class 3 adenylate cyclase